MAVIRIVRSVANQLCEGVDAWLKSDGLTLELLFKASTIARDSTMEVQLSLIEE